MFGLKNIVHSANEALTTKGLYTCVLYLTYTYAIWHNNAKDFFRDKPWFFFLFSTTHEVGIFYGLRFGFYIRYFARPRLSNIIYRLFLILMRDNRFQYCYCTPIGRYIRMDSYVLNIVTNLQTVVCREWHFVRIHR